MKILIIDDHAIIRDGLRHLLTAEGGMQIREAADDRDALAQASAFHPDLLILDLNLPGLGGIELLRRLTTACAGRILILSMHAEPLYVRRALEAGAHGYVSKNAAPGELLTAVRRIAHGERYIEAEIAQALILNDSKGVEPLDALKPREIEIMRLLSSGCSLSEIAAALGVSYKTAANCCAIIKSKLGVARTADLVRLAVDAGIS